MADPTAPPSQALARAVRRLLRPLVRILLRHGVSFKEFAEWAKQVYVEVADRDFPLPGRKQTHARISVLTGLTRKDVQRIRELVPDADADALRQYHRAARVVGGWVRDHRFADARGAPAILPVEGDERSFAALVRAYSGDMPHRAVLDELVRVGAAVREGDAVRLVADAYVPQRGDPQKLLILGTDVEALVETIDHNLEAEPCEARFQRKVAYNNLPVEALPRLRTLGAARAQALLEELDRWLADHDRDTNPDVEGTGRKRAGVGIYYFEGDYDDE